MVKELRGRHPVSAIEESLRTLRVKRESYDLATIVRVLPTEDDDGEDPSTTSLFAADHEPATVVRIAPHVYAETPSAFARIRVLRRAGSFAQSRVEVHAPLTTGPGTYRGRIVFDLPRRAVLQRLDPSCGEPGDRFTSESRATPLRHAFFDDEELIDEAEAADLAFLGRENASVVLSPTAKPHPRRERLQPMALEIARATSRLVIAERARGLSPEEAIRQMRERGVRAKLVRGPRGRARLRRVIGWADAVHAPNCYRRVLAELALDAGAATETLVLGLDVGKTGHIAFKGAEDLPFDVLFELS